MLTNSHRAVAAAARLGQRAGLSNPSAAVAGRSALPALLGTSVSATAPAAPLPSPFPLRRYTAAASSASPSSAAAAPASGASSATASSSSSATSKTSAVKGGPAAAQAPSSSNGASTAATAAAASTIPTLRPVPELEGKLEFLKVTQSSSGIMFVEPNNPPVNALRSEMLTDFENLGAWLRSKTDPSTRVIVMKCDVAGANIKEMAHQTPEEAEAYSKRFKAALEGVRAAHIPMIGYTNRFAIGGGLELLMFCDIRYAGPKALIQAPEVDLDTLQSFGGCVGLPRLLSPSVALRAQLRGDPIPLDIAERDGLLTEVIRSEEIGAVEARAFDDAIHIAHKRPSTVRLNTQATRFAMDKGLGSPEEAHALESKNFGKTFEGGAGGMQAFLQRLRFQVWGHPESGGRVQNIEFKAIGIDTTQIKALISRLRDIQTENQNAEREADKIRAVFFSGGVSGGDVKKLHQALTTDESKFEEFLRLEYQWHELMRTKYDIPLFYFGTNILGGGGFGVFQSMKYRICGPNTMLMMPEIDLGACPDVAGTYDLPRAGTYGRGMAIAALDLNGVEAKAAGLADYLVDPELQPALKEAVFDAILQDADVEAVLNHFEKKSSQATTHSSLLRHSELEWNSVFDSKKSLREIVELAKAEDLPEGDQPPTGLLQRVKANWHPQKASAYGVILSDLMHQEGLELSLTQARALEYSVWLQLDKTDFLESIHSRFILPRKQRRKPEFSNPGIMELSPKQFEELELRVQDLVEKAKSNLSEVESRLFSEL